MKKIFGGCVALLIITGLPLCAGNLLTNGGFETGDFTSWVTGGNFEDTSVVSGAFYVFTGAQEGSSYAVLGPVGGDATLSQTIADSVGSYTFSFWVNAVGDVPSDFSASWNGTKMLGLTNPDHRKRLDPVLVLGSGKRQRYGLVCLRRRPSLHRSRQYLGRFGFSHPGALDLWFAGRRAGRPCRPSSAPTRTDYPAVVAI